MKNILFLSVLLLAAGCATSSQEARYDHDPNSPTGVGSVNGSSQTTEGQGAKKKQDNSPIILGPRYGN